MSDILSSKGVKTRKGHRCWGCTELFAPGSTLTVVVSAEDGKINRAYWCTDCEKIIHENRDDFSDGIGWGEVREYVEQFTDSIAES